jgi:hypothetical protein
MEEKQKRSMKWASITIIGMIMILAAIAVSSGGLSQLGNIPLTITYCLAVSAPLLLVIGLAWRKIRFKQI